MIKIIFNIIILYLIYRLITILIRKGIMYYRVYRAVKQKRREQAVNYKSDLNLQAFDVEDAQFEEVEPGSKKSSG
ncbi:MAG TPA: hypothetical protein VM123_10480 [archaeon]|nr:hypothetical protein [archaeon]